MALIVRVDINDRPLHFMEAVRISGGEQPDDINLYRMRLYSGDPQVRQFDVEVEHRYGDGALALSMKMHQLALGLKEER